MASRRKEHQEDAKLRVFQMINENPHLSSRELAQKVRISNGSAYYLLITLIEKGFVKLGNFKKSSPKSKYAYFLTPKGIREKSLLTHSFIERKREEFEVLRAEIKALEEEVGLSSEAAPSPREANND